MPVSIVGKLYIRIIVYLDDFLILGKTLEKPILSRDTVIYLLQNLGFVTNLKNSVPHPIQKIEFLGMITDFVEISVPTSGEGSANVQKLAGYIFNARCVNKRPSKAFGNIITKALAIIPVTHEVPAETANSQPLLEKRLQQQSSSRCTLHRGTKLVDITLSLSNGRPVISDQVERLIQSDALKTGWGSFSQKSSIAVWSQAEQALHINILQLRAAKFVILTFCRSKKNLAFHVQMDYQALAYLVKMGGTRNLLMIQEAKEIWEFGLANQTTLTAQYLSATLNTTADKASREIKFVKPIF